MRSLEISMATQNNTCSTVAHMIRDAGRLQNKIHELKEIQNIKQEIMYFPLNKMVHQRQPFHIFSCLPHHSHHYVPRVQSSGQEQKK